MLEITLCSLLTILPDYLVRRFVQGRKITFFSVWYELRWGITGCLILTTLLITTVFFFHPATTSATSVFRTIPVLTESVGRVTEIFVKPRERVTMGQILFKLDSTEQQAALELARRRSAEIDARIVMARADIEVAIGQVQLAENALKQISDELRVKQELFDRNSGTVSPRELERLQTALTGAEGTLASARATQSAAEIRVGTLLPAEKASARAALKQAEVELAKKTIYAGVDGQLEQFVLQAGDIVNPVLRPAGILIPAGEGPRRIQAGFNQIEAGVLKPGMAAEATCVAKPLQIIPLVVTGVQGYIASGQLRAGEQLVDVAEIAQPGTILATLEPIYEGGLDGMTPGSNCIVNAYTSFHAELQNPDLGMLQRFGMHAVDAIALVHAMILRAQALFIPVRTLVLKGH
ncbi:MAG: HlyD family secretion protein [Aestuariivirga sp.]|uniref:HlyD family secretion protein n=1 Tax=Aestuariivirga sp. TaxID=2650926 RepID=UPI0025C513B4|nr:biotin/lipoyl-binding protein [Aestuariivirga sp.]MCA3562578.1 HlyD family secretion protein [Aestuariivirga sp.]